MHTHLALPSTPSILDERVLDIEDESFERVVAANLELWVVRHDDFSTVLPASGSPERGRSGVTI